MQATLSSVRTRLLVALSVAILQVLAISPAQASGATTSSSLSITPAAGHVHALGTHQFVASVPATWSASCGTINARSGLFTAAKSAGSCIVTATAGGSTAQATVTVDVLNYLSWKGDSSNTGAQEHETLLTPSTVNPSHFKVKWTAALDGGSWAQPLYMNALTIKGAVRNVVFAATSNDSIYAFDGDTGALLWHKSFLSKGVTAVTATMVKATTPQIGVQGTPVIDAATGTLYLVAETAEQNATYFPHRLHAIDVTTGSEKFNGPVLVSDPNLPPIRKLQRPALTLANGMVYVAFGSIQDKTPYHGIVFAFDDQTLAKKYVWNATGTGSQGGIWMAGGAAAVDASGNLYLATGNGSFNGSTNFGEAVVKLSPTLKVLDYFAPYDYASFDAKDVDMGSGGVALLEGQVAKFPHELVVCGKAPAIYLINGDAMGHVGKVSDNIIQEFHYGSATTENCFATPAFWNNHLYIAGTNEKLKMFTLNPSTGLLSSAVISGTFTYGARGAQPVVSSNGLSNGIVWTLDYGTGQILAYDASNVARELYSGSVPGGVLRFTVPTVVNGHVYVGGQHDLVAYSIQ